MTIDMNSNFMTPIHYDTYPESIDVPGEAVDSLNVAIDDFKISSERVVVLAIGEQHVFSIGDSRSARAVGD